MEKPKILDNRFDHLSEEEFMIHMAKESKEHDMLSAKSWLITAQTMFPQNFGILVIICLCHCR